MTAERGVFPLEVGRDGLEEEALNVGSAARTPSRPTVTTQGSGWAGDVLHQLPSVVYAGVKRFRSDTLVITQTPHPSYADVTDMVRLA